MSIRMQGYYVFSKMNRILKSCWPRIIFIEMRSIRVLYIVLLEEFEEFGIYIDVSYIFKEGTFSL